MLQISSLGHYANQVCDKQNKYFFPFKHNYTICTCSVYYLHFTFDCLWRAWTLIHGDIIVDQNYLYDIVTFLWYSDFAIPYYIHTYMQFLGGGIICLKSCVPDLPKLLGRPLLYYCSLVGGSHFIFGMMGLTLDETNFPFSYYLLLHV